MITVSYQKDFEFVHKRETKLKLQNSFSCFLVQRNASILPNFFGMFIFLEFSKPRNFKKKKSFVILFLKFRWDVFFSKCFWKRCVHFPTLWWALRFSNKAQTLQKWFSIFPSTIWIWIKVQKLKIWSLSSFALPSLKSENLISKASTKVVFQLALWVAFSETTWIFRKTPSYLGNKNVGTRREIPFQNLLS